MSYESPCFRMLDEPVLVWLGLEFHEVVTGIAGGAGVAVVGAFFLGLGFPGLLAGFAAGGGLLLLFRARRRAGPGHVFAWLYRAGVIDFLPAGLRPRHLLPLAGVSVDRGRLRLSPVAGKDQEHAGRARAYHGR